MTRFATPTRGCASDHLNERDSVSIEIIHIYLPDEAVDTWFPVRAEHLGDDRYRILEQVQSDARGQFGKDDIVRCRTQKLGAGIHFEDALVAFDKISK